MQQHLALGRPVKAADGAQQRRLAAARGAEQDEVLAGGDAQVDVLERNEIAVVLGQAPHFDGGGGGLGHAVLFPCHDITGSALARAMRDRLSARSMVMRMILPISAMATKLTRLDMA